jgi:uncharacterized protein (DUF924 family)
MVPRMTVASSDEVLAFWFPQGRAASWEALRSYYLWCMRGGADAAIIERFAPTLEAAIAGELDGWAGSPRGRLALILVLDQFSRSIFKGSPKMYAQDPKALALALEGLDNGLYAALTDPDEQTFFVLPLGHSEGLGHHERVFELTRAIAAAAPAALRPGYEFSAGQAEITLDVIRRFGRFPHRNELLGRASTAEEAAYVAAEIPAHLRAVPP